MNAEGFCYTRKPAFSSLTKLIIREKKMDRNASRRAINILVFQYSFTISLTEEVVLLRKEPDFLLTRGCRVTTT